MRVEFINMNGSDEAIINVQVRDGSIINFAPIVPMLEYIVLHKFEAVVNVQATFRDSTLLSEVLIARYVECVFSFYTVEERIKLVPKLLKLLLNAGLLQLEKEAGTPVSRIMSKLAIPVVSIVKAIRFLVNSKLDFHKAV